MKVEGDQGRWAWLRNNWPLVFAVLLTVLFFVWTGSIFLGADCGLVNCESRLDQFLNSSNNEMGDTLSGFVGSLTLIWVVASVLQQSMELRAQRREFAEMVRAQDAQVAALQLQSELFKEEQADREKSRVDGEVNERIVKLAYGWSAAVKANAIVGEILELRIPKLEKYSSGASYISALDEFERNIDALVGNYVILRHADEAIRNSLINAQFEAGDIESAARSSKYNFDLDAGRDAIKKLNEIRLEYQAIQGLSERASEAARIRLRRLHVLETSEKITEICRLLLQGISIVEGANESDAEHDPPSQPSGS